MASISKRGEKWKAEVYKFGKRKSATFSTKAEAVRWAAITEHELLSMSNGEIPKEKTFADLLDKYAQEVSVTKRSAKWEQQRIEHFKTMAICAVKLDRLSEVDVYKWRDMRLKEVTSSSVARDWGIMNNACNIALREWKWLKINPFELVRKPSLNPPRTRRVSDHEVVLICDALGYDDKAVLDTQKKRVAGAFLFAIETAMRMGEIAALTWDNIHEKHAHLPKTKNGHHRDVPLSAKARGILAQLPRKSDRCFHLHQSNIDGMFRSAKNACGIVDLHFHDSRAEALSRLAKILPPHALAKVSGHRDLKILLNTYYRPTVSELTDYFD